MHISDHFSLLADLESLLKELLGTFILLRILIFFLSILIFLNKLNFNNYFFIVY